MKIATWNVNSIRARLDRLLRFLERHRPDVVCLQEIKIPTEAFPFEAVRAAGYHAAVFGQKTYNGVAILSRTPPENVQCGLGDDVEDPQARLISARIDGIQVLSVYVPNGSTIDSDKYVYKLQWLQRLRQYLQRHHDPSEHLALCGDFNVAPDDALDVAEPALWKDSVLCHRDAREAFASLCAWGLRDLFRHVNPEAKEYSWWDYRMLAFPKNNGLRIDHLLTTESLTRRCTTVLIDRDERKGQGASDHAPVIAVFD